MTKTTRRIGKLGVLAGATALLLGQSAGAAVLFQDNFDSYTNTALEGQGGWASDAVGNDATVTSGSVETATASGHRGIQHSLTTTHTVGQTIYMAFNVQDAGDDSYVVGLALGASDDIKWTGGGSAARIGIAGNLFKTKLNSESNTTINPVDGTTYLLVAKLEFDVGGVNERLTMWIDPSDESDTPAKVNDASDLGWTQATHVGLASINYDGNSPEALSDNVIVATSFDEAIGVPEPSTALLAGLIAPLMLCRRRA